MTENKPIGLCLSGGGSRAIAFHLGCLRSLNKLGLLDKVGVISAVSGGSIIGAMYAFSKEPFSEFDARVVELLKRGLMLSIARELFLSPVLFKSLATVLTSGITAIPRRLLGQQPMRRWSSRTDAFERALDRELFKGLSISSERRAGTDIVINACELRTGSAFRFGSRESGCWRYGRLVENNVSLAHAVAASAAYPIFLPALDRTYVFTKAGATSENRVILADGGLYDNLGTTCVEPGRKEEYSTNVFRPQYIVSCNAGYGIFSDGTVPYGFFSRITRAFETEHRKVQDAAMKRLFEFSKSHEIRGFVLAYLGQQDKVLPSPPADLVRREQVNYPTDFCAMTEEKIDLCSRRGEQLMALLVNTYCPELGL